MMGKNAWLIVSDLHLYYKNISSRIDYVREMRDIRGKIIELGVKYKELGYDNVNLLLLGDVFHRSYRDTFITGYDNNFFIVWNQRFGECYSVIGNHELNFYDSNPFFTLMNTIESEKIKQISNKVWAPRGLMQIINVTDRMDDGEVHFYFNHYGTHISRPDADGVNIGLFHQEIVCSEIVEAMQNKLGGKIWANTVSFKNLDVFDGYQYCFLGHMHTIYGIWKGDNGCILCYLASLGRTNVSEVMDNFLERDIPAVLVKDGRLESVDSNKFKLPGVSECINPEVAVSNQHKQEIKKICDYTRKYDVLNEDPVKSLFQYFADDDIAVEIIHHLLTQDIDDFGQSIKLKFSRRMNNGY